MHNYNAKKVVVIFGGVLMTGLENTFVKIMRSNPVFSKKVGVDGQLVRSLSNDKSGSVEITLQDHSESNDFLTASLAVDEASGLGMKPLLVQDLNGRTLMSAMAAWVTGYADVEYAAEAGAKVWKLECDNLQMNVGGSL